MFIDCKNKKGTQTCIDQKAEMYDTCVRCFALMKHTEAEDDHHPSFFPKIFYAEDLLELKYKKDK
jgi:hypothetical protein